MTRRGVLRAAGLTAVGLGGAAGVADLAAGITASGAAARLQVGYLPITDATPLLMAHARGSFDAPELAAPPPVLFRSWASLGEALISGKVDLVHLLMPAALQLRYDLGADVKVLGWNHTNGSAMTVAPSIDSVEQLAGRAFAIPHWWSVHNVVLQAVLREAGLTPVVREAPSAQDGTVQLVVMSPADLIPALKNGVIGGYVVADPFNAAAEAQGVGRILRFLGDVWRDHACCALVTRGDVIRRDPEAVQAMVDGIVVQQLWSRQHRVQAAGLLSGRGYLPQPLPAIEASLTYDEAAAAKTLVTNPAFEGQRLDFAPWPYRSYTEELVTRMRETTVDGDRRFLDRLGETPHSDLVDDTFVARSLQRNGGFAAFDLPGPSRTEQVVPA
ncbi:ABC transporter substrate-binding protein [Nocardioides rotundus]|uniref:ABC transporter substrate-binding protein n=1 Tax=Nocardioides rotundus TaxID=1774216 RepID=UPI001CBF0E19|nr:ABC transporter substrate-binding protein [Nocardioides rotundus]